jgi:hypothetical protein
MMLYSSNRWGEAGRKMLSMSKVERMCDKLVEDHTPAEEENEFGKSHPIAREMSDFCLRRKRLGGEEFDPYLRFVVVALERDLLAPANLPRLLWA